MRRDLKGYLGRLVPRADAPAMDWLRHVAEGTDDSLVPIRAALLLVSLSIPVSEECLALGTGGSTSSITATGRTGARWWRIWGEDAMRMECA